MKHRVPSDMDAIADRLANYGIDMLDVLHRPAIDRTSAATVTTGIIWMQIQRQGGSKAGRVGIECERTILSPS
jgi:hypothetical protein